MQTPHYSSQTIQINSPDSPISSTNFQILESILKGDARRLEALLKESPLVDVNWATPVERRTPLHFAASTGNIAVIQVLLNVPSTNVDSQDHVGNTPLHLSVACEEFQVVKLLVKNGADLFLCNNHGNRALEYAKTPEIQAYLTEAMVSHGFNQNDRFVDKDEAVKLFMRLKISLSKF